MAFSEIEILKAKENYEKLHELQLQRKMQELEWQKEIGGITEEIIEPTSIDFPDVHGNTLLDYAIIASNLDLIETLLEQGATSQQALVLAIQAGNESICALLKAKGLTLQYEQISSDFLQNPNIKFFVDTIALEKFDKLHQSLLDTPVSPWDSGPISPINKDGSLWHHVAFFPWTIFMARKEKKSLRTISWKEGMEEYDSAGYAPIHYGIEAGNSEFVKFLLENGCDVNKSMQNAKMLPIHIALLKGDLEMVRMLQKNGADLAARDYEGNDALMLAIQSDNLELIRYVLEQNIEYSMRDYFGITPLHLAAKLENEEIIAMLLENERCQNLITSVDLFGRDPLQVALECDNEVFIKLAGEERIKDRVKKERAYIPQDHILTQLRYYLRLTNQDPMTLRAGHCNGLEFIALYFSDIEKHDHFIKILKLMSEWDGEFTSLNQYEPVKGIYGDFDNIGQLFRHYVDYIIWLQQDNLDPELKKLNPTQQSRIEQFSLFKKSDHNLCDKKHFEVKTGSKTKAKIAEYIEIVSRLPGSKIEVGGGRHACSLAVHNKKNLEYYDPNALYEFKPFDSVTSLANAIKEIKYSMNGLPDEEMSFAMWVYQSQNFNSNTFTYFKKEELSKPLDSPNGFSHCHIAVLTDSLRDIKKILSLSSYDINSKDKEGNTPLDLAIKFKKNDIINEFLQCSRLDLDQCQFLVLVDNEILLEKLMQHANFKNSNGLLNNAVLNSNEKLVRRLLEKGIDPNEKDDNQIFGSTLPLNNALKSSNLVLCQLLMEAGAKLENVDKSGNNPLVYLASVTQEEIVDYFLKNHLSEILNISNDIPNNVFSWLSTNNPFLSLSVPSKKILLKTIEFSPNIMQLNAQGFAPIHLLVSNKENDIELYHAFDMRLQQNAIDLNQKTQEGESPLIVVLKKKFLPNVTAALWLIEKGADVNSADQQGIPPLIYAVRNHKNKTLTSALLKAGADVNYQSRLQKNTALHYAVIKKDIEMAKILLAYGADIHIKNESKKSPLDMAIENKDEEMIQVLTQKNEEVLPMKPREEKRVKPMVYKKRSFVEKKTEKSTSKVLDDKKLDPT